jgi:ABC-2 type transport system ATP-binding protein
VGVSEKDIIIVKDLVKKYNGFTAVNGVSFSVKEGELFGILGPNGAGKTTTLEIIETLKSATSGEVTVDGHDVRKEPWLVKEEIGVQLQSAGFYPQLTLVDLLHFFASLYDIKVNPIEVLKEFNLEEKASSFYDKLSGGQKQRFSVATTLINSPKVIFLDEPTTGLDPQARLNLWELIEEIKKKGVTVVLTTHYMEEAERLCDRIAIMDAGKIIKIGTPESLINDLLKTGFRREVEVRQATLEDVFINLTGKALRED